MAEKLIIKKRGSDGFKTFSIRIKEETVERIDEIASKTERSRNEIIAIFLEYAIKNCEVR